LSEHDLPGVERLRQPLGGIAADAAQPDHREEGLVRKPASSPLARKVPAGGFDLLADLHPGQAHEEESGIAEIGVVFWNFVLEHQVIAEGVVGELGQQPVVLLSVALPMSQDERRIKIAFEGLEVVLDIGALEGEIPVAEPQHLDPFSGNIFEKGGAVLRLSLAQAGAAEDDPPRDEIWRLCSKAQDRSVAADLDVIGVDCDFYRDGWLYNDSRSRPLTFTKDVRRITAKDLEGFDAVVVLAEQSSDPLAELNGKMLTW